ncbi:caldesmon-like [Engraulis encrasicolus]|uniref:caldesmon-like n=1 Tax=Engraulis encrasicolus TaxID=184585 RepID=UPI002FD3F02E
MERELYKRKLKELQKVVGEMRRELEIARMDAEYKLDVQRNAMDQVMGQWKLERRRAEAQKEKDLELRQIRRAFEEARTRAEVVEKTEERGQTSCRPHVDMLSEDRKKAIRKKARALRQQQEEEREAQDSQIKNLGERLAVLEQEKSKAPVNVISEKRRKAFLKKARALREKKEQEREAQQHRIGDLEARIAALELERSEAPIAAREKKMDSAQDFDSEDWTTVEKPQDIISKVPQTTGSIDAKKDEVVINIEEVSDGQTDAKKDEVVINVEEVSDGQAENFQGQKPSSVLSWITNMLGFGGH